ncbi:tryptophan halogenase family protein [Caulobacter sp. BK020]|uniref:tryptophan halogenase family protein n=1 Tax=Caulobacter sp. BK020 TaxID=2512117 RepID=UPI001FB4B146|nr:tryptophan halogenase family protein [Caulobacter sp. BK020]
MVVGGGTAGWLTAGYLARTLDAQSHGGVEITLVESAQIGFLGVGEGVFPTIRKTLQRIGIDEATLVREASATFKQGARFAHWRFEPGGGQPDHYLYPFQATQEPSGPDLQHCGLSGDHVATPNHACHLDAVKLAGVLRNAATGLGVRHVVDTIDQVPLTEDGAIAAILGRASGRMTADLYVDCTGFRAQLIGHAQKSPYKSCRSALFCDSALAMQVPYERPDASIASYTISTAQEAGWTWDVGLNSRRGVGHVFSSDHTDAETAERVLRDYVGKAGDGLDIRHIKFEAGYREISWRKNCVAIGLSSGFLEPLEATDIAFTEVAAVTLGTLFPWGGEMETAARRYNDLMRRRYERALDFIKLHYCISERRDTAFWRNNVEASTIPDSLHDLLDRWRFRPPDAIDIDPNADIFTEASWRYVLYGMGYRTDLSPKADACRDFNRARPAFEDIRQQAAYAYQNLPTHRERAESAQRRGFGEG